MLPLAPELPFWHGKSRKRAKLAWTSGVSATPWIDGINRILAGISRALVIKSGSFPLDCGPFIRYPSTNTPASPLPLVGDAHPGQVFLFADVTASHQPRRPHHE